MLKTIALCVCLALAACGGGGTDSTPIGAISSTAINDGATFDLPADILLPHRLRSLDYVNTGAEPVDLVLALRASEELASTTDGARVTILLSAGGELTQGLPHAALYGSTVRWTECIELRATAGPGAVLTAEASALLAGAGTLDSRGVVVEAVIYPHGRAPETPAC